MGGLHIAEALRIPYYRAFTVCLLVVMWIELMMTDALDEDSCLSCELFAPV